ncbi:LamG-like jellyroll fold domain-containing protein [Actinoplanes sp. CA-131856]
MATEAAAVQAALACHGRVEVLSERDERTQVFANSTGTFTSQTGIEVQRVRDAAGAWVAPDVTLKADGKGRITPAATSMALSFSGGGTGPAVTLGKGSSQLSLTWPTALPTPKTDGDDVTYPEVLPGVDLVLTAHVEGFSETLVVKNAKAAANPALSAVKFTTTTKNLKLKQATDGGVSAVDASGKTLFGSGTPTMWDSSETGAPGAAPETASKLAVAGARSKAMPVELDGNQLIVHPDAALLSNPATKFPVYIDPGFKYTAWTMINSKFPSQSYWSYDKQDCPDPYGSILCAKVGYTNEPQAMIYRSLFLFNVSTLRKKHVTKAILSMDTVYSYTNTDYPTQIHPTGTITSSTNWSNNAATWGPGVASALSHAHDRVRRRTEWSVLGPVQKAAAENQGTITIGLRAANESSLVQWKKFDASKGYLSVDYNSYPSQPTVQSIGEMPGCKSGASRPYVRTLTPTIVANLNDADGDSLKGIFYWFKTGGVRNSTDVVTQTSITSGQNAIVKIPAGRLQDGATYTLQAFAQDKVDNSQPTTCEFTVDVTAPLPPSAVVSTIYPNDGQANGGVGVTGAFQIKPPTTIPGDFWGYAYSLDPAVSPASAKQVEAPKSSTAAVVTSCASASQAPTAAKDRSVTVCLTPTVDRSYNLRVWSRDKAGNFSAAKVYSFTVAAGAGPAARWTFDDGDGKDVAEHGNTATLANATFEPGRGKYGQAFKANGTSTYAVTAGPITTRNSAGQSITLHPNQSFSVAATVKLDSTTGTGQRVIAAQDGTRTSPFLLSYSIADKKWRFAVAATDVDAPTTAAVLSNATATTGTWTRLYATYDGTSHALRLYVNGVLQTATATGTTFDSAKPVTIGRSLQAGAAAGFFSGSIDDVRIYNRIVGTSDVEFTNMQRVNPPVVTFTGTKGNQAYSGRTLSVLLDAGGDTSVTTVQYQLGTGGAITKVALSAAGGSKTVSIAVPGSMDGPTDLNVASIDSSGLSSLIDTHEVIVVQPSTITGHVRDIKNKPMAGIAVKLTPGDLTEVTDAAGAYTFAVDDTTYTMTADNSNIGCASATYEREVVVDGSTTQEIILAPDSDTYGYTCMTASSTAFLQGSTKLNLSGDDEATQVTALPFTMPYYGNSYDSLWVSTNGFVSFTDPAEHNYYSGVSLPDRHSAPSAALAPYWSDLVIDDSASVWTATTGTGAEQRYVIEWRNAQLAGTDSRVSFDAVLAPNGDVTFNYSGLNDELAKGTDTVVGITSPGGNYGRQYAFQQPDLASGTAVTFAAPEQPGPSLNGALTGTVWSADDEPLAGVQVWLDDWTTTTDEFGMYHFEGMENGTYNLYAAQGCNEVELPEGTVDGIGTYTDLKLGPASDTFGNKCSLTSAAWTSGDTPVSFGENGYETSVALPFPVSFYGHAFNDLTVQSWGAVAFADPADSTLGGGVQVWPGVDPNTDEQTKVYTKFAGTAPNRQFVIEWRNVGLTDVPDARVDLELVIDESGTITANINNQPDRSLTNKDFEIYFWGNDYNSIGYFEDGNGLRAGRSITFTPPTAA